MYMLILNFTYPLRCLRIPPGVHVPPVEYHWSRESTCKPGAVSLGVKRQGREADHSPPSNAEVKECVALYLRFPNTPSWRGAQFKKEHRDNFTFAFKCTCGVRLLKTVACLFMYVVCSAVTFLISVIVVDSSSQTAVISLWKLMGLVLKQTPYLTFSSYHNIHRHFSCP
jgi:hypothetical protein